MSEHPPKKPKKSGSRKTAGKEPVHIVIVEDEKAHAELIRRGLLSFENPYRLTVAATLEEARVVLAEDPPDFMILDQLLPDGKGEDLLPENPEDIRFPVIVMTSFGDKALALHLMQRGAVDYFVKSKPVFDDLTHIVTRTIQTWNIRQERRKLEGEFTSNASLLKTLINNPVDSIALLDEKGTILDLNTTLAGRMGTTVTNAIGTCAYELIPEPLAHARRKKIDTVFKTGVIARFEDEWNGRWYDNLVQPVRDSTGRVTRVIVNARDITKEKNVDLELRGSEEKYRFLVENVEDIVFQTTPELLFSYLSPSTQKLTGYSIGELTGNSLFSVITEESVRKVKDRLNIRRKEFDLGEKGQGIVVEVEMLKKEGSTIWLEVSSKPVFGPDNALIGFQGICRNITARRRAEEALRESEERYRTLINELPDYVLVHRSGEMLYVNAPLAERLGYPPEDLLHTSLFQYVAPECHETIRNAMEKRVEGTVLPPYVVKIFIRDGSVCWVEIRGALITFEGQRACLNVLTDITDKKSAEKALADSELKFRTLADFTYDWEYWVRPDGGFIYISPSCEQISGYTQEEFYQDKTLLSRIVHPDDHGIFIKHLETLETSPEKEVVEFRIITKIGDLRWINHKCQQISGPKGDNLGRRVSNQDITLRKRSELITTLSNRIYQSANRVDSLKEMLKSCVEEFRGFSGCEAVGIRLLDAEGNIPYQAYCGFPEHFYEKETPLSIKSDECMCIYVIKGTINPDLPVSTPKGSFYCNATSRLLASVPEEEKGRTRNVCNQMGYESVALIPIRTAAGILGLVQFNDHRENMVPFEMVSIVEEVALPLGETIRMMQAEQALREGEEKFRILFNRMIEGNALHEMVFDSQGKPIDYRILDVNRAFEGITGIKREEVIGKTSREAYRVDTPQFLDIYARVADSSEPEVFESYFEPMDKHFAISAYSPGKGKFATIFQDITERKLAEEVLLDNKTRLETAMEIANLANWEFDVETSTFIFNDRFYDLYGTTAEREGGYHMAAEVYIREFVHPDDLKSVNRVFGDAAAGIFPNYSMQLEHRIIRRDGHVRYIVVSSGAIKDASGKDKRVHGANQDITDRKMMEEEVRSLNRVLEMRVAERTDQLNASLDEKVLLLREIHHRVKNNLQIVASLFNLQSRYIVDPTALEAIRESQNRVRAMALVHERIYRSENVGSIDLKEYLTFLGEQVFRYYGVKSSQITLSLSVAAIRMDIDTAIPLGLVINEMLSNSLKHGFPDGRKGTISIACCECDKEISLVFNDDGVGLPEGLNWKNPPSLGLRLIISLVRQLKGKVELDPSPGTTFRITAPLVHSAQHQETGSMLN